MGIYVNPGNEEFKRAANSKIYVDKTMLLAFTNQNLKSEHQNICVSRPRRFGKSMAANMLVAYYGKGDDSYELFEPFKFAKDPDFKKHLNQYNAIHLIYNFDLDNPEIFQNYLDQIFEVRDMSANIRQDVTVNADNRIVTLSTCVSGEKNMRYLVQGVLLNE